MNVAGEGPSTAVENRIPTRWDAAVFRLKATVLQARRFVQDCQNGIQCYPVGKIDEFSHIIAESRSPLWNEANAAERLLQRGKVQNLRCAVRHLNGAVIPADGLFSFWKQIGQATRRRGYVPGRLLREGCLMPAVGGGLCQLSNALYDVALQAGCEIVERWPHSRIIPGSAAEQGRDATVAWNYIDLRFRPANAVLLEAVLTRDELIIRVRSKNLPAQSTPIIPLSALTKPRFQIDIHSHSCGSCGQRQCFRHAPSSAAQSDGATAFIVNECWPEFREYLAQYHAAGDTLALPMSQTTQRMLRIQSSRYQWDEDGFARVLSTPVTTMRRSWHSRRWGRYGAARLQKQLEDDATLAGVLSRVLSMETTHVIVAQSLLPFLWRDGHLGGRSFDVLMTRLPFGELHRRLDEALQAHPERDTLGEFRAPSWLVEAEAEALSTATQIITPHVGIAGLFPEKVHRLSWHLPQRNSRIGKAKRIIAFPGPTAARKGCYELRDAARELNFAVRLLGSELEGEKFWQVCSTHRAAGNWLENVAAVMQPALIEENPRRLLEALACGVPVIATPECGLEEQAGVTLVPAGDTDALTAALTGVAANLSLNSPIYG